MLPSTTKALLIMTGAISEARNRIVREMSPATPRRLSWLPPTQGSCNFCGSLLPSRQKHGLLGLRHAKRDPEYHNVVPRHFDPLCRFNPTTPCVEAA